MSLAIKFSDQELPRSLTPPLKWAGGKRWLVPQLEKIFSRCKASRLCEPFVGGLAVALGLNPKRAILSDSNSHLINFYRCLQAGLSCSLEFCNDEKHYYQLRDRFNLLIEQGQAEGIEAAQLFYYLNRTGFNGLCRFNSSGKFNVPFGRYGQINYRQDFLEYKQALANWQFQITDFEQIAPESNDFVYADPPYDVEFTRYSKDDFTWHDQERLALWLSRHSGPVVASNQATKRIVELYADLGFLVQTLDAPRRISCNGDRRPAEEILATRNLYPS